MLSFESTAASSGRCATSGRAGVVGKAAPFFKPFQRTEPHAIGASQSVLVRHSLPFLQVLCDSKGKSMSVLLVEFSKQEGVQQALRADGICRIRLLQGFGLQPRAMEVSLLAEPHVSGTRQIQKE